MRDFTDAQQQSDWVMPPMFTTGATGGATGSTISSGQVYPATGPTVLAVSTTVVVLDLTTICGSGAKARVDQGADDYNPTPIAHYLTLEADGDDIYFAFGDSVAALGTISPTAVTAVTSNAAASPFTSSGGTLGGGTVGCLKLPNNTSKDYKLPVGTPPVGTPYDNSAPQGKWSPARYLAYRSNTGATVFLRIYQSSP